MVLDNIQAALVIFAGFIVLFDPYGRYPNIFVKIVIKIFGMFMILCGIALIILNIID